MITIIYVVLIIVMMILMLVSITIIILYLDMHSCHNDMRAMTPVFLRVEQRSFSRTIQSNL